MPSAVYRSAVCFNPRTHMGCDQKNRDWQEDYYKFQSTHPHGVRPVINRYSCSSAEFQSTHPHGVRPTRATMLSYGLVSIHAPTWGATIEPSIICNALWFQSTHSHGVRLPCCSMASQSSMFQSTHPHGVRLIIFCLILIDLTVSIHAPTWGATYHDRLRNFIKDVSIHAPTWGATGSTCN